MNRSEKLKAAQSAKACFERRYADAPWVRGVGIGVDDGQFSLRVNVTASAKLPEELTGPTYDDVPLQIVRIDHYSVQ